MGTTFDFIWNSLQSYINIPYLGTFMLFSYLTKEYLKSSLVRIFGERFKTVYIVLVIALVTAIPYFVFAKIPWQILLFSYALGTSLHELVFAWIKKKYKGVWILLLCLVSGFSFLESCKQSPTDMVSIKKSTWDSILSIKETPPKITIDTVYLKGDVVYVERKFPVPIKSQKDTTITVYTDSLVNKEISVWVKDTVKGVLVSREWKYSPIVQKIVKETTIYQPKIVMVDVPINIPKNGFYFYALTGGNSNAFIYGGGIDWITKKDRQIGYSYQRFGSVGFHSIKIGVRVKRPGN